MEITSTSRFFVYDYSNISSSKIALNDINVNFQQLQQLGYVILRECISETDQLVLRATFQKLLQSIRLNYDMADDNFESLNKEGWSITRLPRIGNGKHNVHFDAFESEHHAVLAEVVHSCGIMHLLREYLGDSVQLRETGLSVTRPSINGMAGEGMEWHSDGSAGECTMLLSLDNIAPQTGSLCISPSSHLEYKLGEGHTCIDAHANDQRMLVYPYQTGSPVIIDARTLHRVTPNVSSNWRFVIWLIFDSY